MARKALTPGPTPGAAGNRAPGAGTPGGAAPAPAALRPLPRQRSRKLLLLGIALVGLGALVGWQVFISSTDRAPVLVAVRDIPVGTRLAAADVTTARVSADTKFKTIGAGQLRQVVGLTTAVDLRQGTPLSQGQLTTSLAPGPGQELVPVAFKRAQLPARGLQPGDQVRLRLTLGQGQDPGPTDPKASPQPSDPRNGQPADLGAGAGPDTIAVVQTVGEPDPNDGTTTIDLIVPATQAPTLISQAGTGRIAIGVLPRRP